jgi:hypothetical protein
MDKCICPVCDEDYSGEYSEGDMEVSDNMYKCPSCCNWSRISEWVSYSTEYKVIPKREMIRLMVDEGLTLEFEDHYEMWFQEDDHPYAPFIKAPRGTRKDIHTHSLPVGQWEIPCRVYVAPKTETAHWWTAQHKKERNWAVCCCTTMEEAEKYFGDYWYMINKIPGSSFVREIEPKDHTCNGECPKCCS